MERKWRAKEGFIITFINFSKVFDSLVWDTLWRIMACLGCPKKMIAVVKSLYTQSTISIRLSKDGELAPKFVQKKGTRQVGVISVHIHDASGLCHKGSGFGMRRVGYGE